VIREPALSSLVPTVASQSAVTFLPTLQLRGYCCARVEARSALQKFKTLQVRISSPMKSMANMSADMPEKEATYIITNGGINDPEKV
jgi:hypothetical protein